MQQKDFYIVTVNSVSSVSFVKLSWLVRTPHGSIRSCRGRLRRTQPLNSAAANQLRVSFDLFGGDPGWVEPCCQTGKSVDGAKVCLRQSDGRILQIQPCQRRDPLAVDVSLNNIKTIITAIYLLYNLTTQKRLGAPMGTPKRFLHIGFLSDGNINSAKTQVSSKHVYNKAWVQKPTPKRTS